MSNNSNSKNPPKVIFKKLPKKINKKSNKEKYYKNNKKKNKFYRDRYKESYYTDNKNKFYEKNLFTNYKHNNTNYNTNMVIHPKKKPPLYPPPQPNVRQFVVNNNMEKKYFDKLKKSKNDQPNEFVFEFDPNKEGSSNILEVLFKSIMKKEKNTEEKETITEEKKEKFTIDYQKEINIIDQEVDNIGELLKLGKLFKEKDFNQKNYTVNIEAIYKMTNSLQELQSLVGLKNIKKKLVDQIKFFCQNFHNQYIFSTQPPKKKMSFFGGKDKPLKSVSFNKNESCLQGDDDYDMMHTVIEGPPGVGKTIFGKILARIYLSLGISNKDTFKIVRRSDLIGEYLGHTARLTEKAIDEAIGGVLFIDEAYSLGNGSDKKMDSYSKECIDTINQALTERKGQFICIIAGYKDELEKNFFSVNRGLKRRFSFTYSIEKYTWKELTEILIQKIDKIKWKIEEDTKKWLFSSQFFKKKMDYLPHFGGDIETLILNIKIEHSSRVFGKHYKCHKLITQKDIENGFQQFLERKKPKKNYIPLSMYN